MSIHFNLSTLHGLIFGNLILMWVSGKTLGGMVMSYKYDEVGFIGLMKVWMGILVAWSLYALSGTFELWKNQTVDFEKNDLTLEKKI